MPEPQPHQCWCLEPKRPGFNYCDRHLYAQTMFAETGVVNWAKGDNPYEYYYGDRPGQGRGLD